MHSLRFYTTKVTYWIQPQKYNMLKTNRFIMTLASIIVLLSIFSSLLATNAEPENDNSVAIRLAVHILDIDQSQKSAELKLHVFINDFPYNESTVGVWVVGAGSIMVECNNTRPNRIGTWSLQGESKQTTWLLEGIGEHFPFDSYNLRFMVYNVEYVSENYILSSEGHQAFFRDSRAYSLNDYWLLDNGLLPIGSIGAKEISFVVQRNPNIFNIAVLQFLVPIIGCYYLLGATLMINPRDQLAARLRIYLSLFVFVPTFLLAIQKFLPYRSSFSFPEFLLVNLTVSTIVLGIFSVIGSQKDKPKSRKIAHNSWDIVASSLSLILLLIIYAFTLFGKINVPASLVFTYFVIPSYIIFHFAMMTKEQLLKKSRILALFILLALIPLFILLFLYYLQYTLG